MIKMTFCIHPPSQKLHGKPSHAQRDDRQGAYDKLNPHFNWR